MVQLHWDNADRDTPGEGNYFAEVSRADYRVSQSAGDGMFVISLIEIPSRKFLTQDNAMIEGGGAGIGFGKLRMLGVERGQEDLNPSALEGKRVYIALKVDEYQGQKRLKVDISAKGSSVGYWAEDNPPANVSKLADDDGVRSILDGPAETTPF